MHSLIVLQCLYFFQVKEFYEKAEVKSAPGAKVSKPAKAGAPAAAPAAAPEKAAPSKAPAKKNATKKQDSNKVC